MVKAPILSPTPPSSTSLSPTHDEQQDVGIIADVDDDSDNHNTSSTPTTTTTTTPTEPSIKSDGETKKSEKTANYKKVKIRLDDLVMAENEPKPESPSKIKTIVVDSNSSSSSSSSTSSTSSDCVPTECDVVIGVDETDQRETSNITNSTTTNTITTKTSSKTKHYDEDTTYDTYSLTVPTLAKSGLNNNDYTNQHNYNDKQQPLTVTVSPIIPHHHLLTPITIGIAQQPSVSQQSQSPIVTLASTQQISQIQVTQQQQAHQGPSLQHTHHHFLPIHVISIPQPPPPGTAAAAAAAAAAVTGAWPLVEAPIYVDSNGEPRHYCPAHSQGPAPREHRVLLQLDAGVSLPLQIAGKRKVFRASLAKSQWKTLRDCLREALKRRSTKSRFKGQIEKPWRFQNQMKFLVKHMKRRTTATSNDNSHLEKILEHKDTTTTTTLLSTPTKKKSDVADPALHNFFLSMYETVLNLPKQSQIEVKKEIFQVVTIAEEHAIPSESYVDSKEYTFSTM